MKLLNLLVVLCLLVTKSAKTASSQDYIEKLRKSLNGSIFIKGTLAYEKRRLVHNALCESIYPDLIVLPKSTKDVSNILRITDNYDVPISVRSGGHSYTCTSIKQGGVHIDLRAMNKIELLSPYLAQLGPGSTWNDVLDVIPPTDFTMRNYYPTG